MAHVSSIFPVNTWSGPWVPIMRPRCNHKVFTHMMDKDTVKLGIITTM